MKVCENCKHFTVDSKMYCFNCGTKLKWKPLLRCCERELGSVDNFCEYCGKPREEIQKDLAEEIALQTQEAEATGN